MEHSDTELVMRLVQHDGEAFDVLFRRYYRYLYRVAIDYVKSPDLAEDIVQEVYLKLWLNRTQLDATKPVRAYLATAMRNQAINCLRDEKRAILRHIEQQTYLASTDNATEELIAMNEYRSVVQQALQQIPTQRRLVFTLRSEGGLTNEQVAAQLNISINTVKVHYYQASRFLREYLRQYADIITAITCLLTLSIYR